MDYTVALCLHKLPGAVEKKVMVGGIEQKCLCIPIDSAVFHTTKKGWKFVQITLREREEMIGTDSHIVYFSYPDSRKLRAENKSVWCGKCKISQQFEFNEDRKVTTEFTGHGVVCIDDFPEEAIFEKDGKKYAKILIRPMVEKDRGGNDLIIAIDPKYGADHGRRESLFNGHDAPLIEVGRMRDGELPVKPMFANSASANENEDADGAEGRKIDGILF